MRLRGSVPADRDEELTAAAVLALQSLRLTTPAGLQAEAYWDVESTVWLSWQFTVARLVEAS